MNPICQLKNIGDDIESIVKWLCAGLSLALMAGCDLPVPQQASPPSVASDVVSKDGLGGYDWVLDHAGFELPKVKTFPILNTIDRAKVRNNLKRPKYEEPSSPSRPDWMAEDIYGWYRRFSEPHWAPKTLLSVKLADDASASVAALNHDGSRLLVVSKEIDQWDVATGKKLSSKPSPIPKCRWVEYDTDGRTALLHNGAELVRVSIDDGKTIQKWQPPNGEILQAAKAREADAIAVCTSTNELFALTNGLATVLKYQHGKLSTPNIAIHPLGTWILGVSGNNALRWFIQQEGHPIETQTPSESIGSTKCFPVSGKESDRWVTPFFIYEKNPMPPNTPAFDQNRHPNFLPNGIVRYQGSGTIDGSQDWLVIYGVVGDYAGHFKNYIQDLHLATFTYSEPWTIPFENFFILSANWSWEKIAFKVDDAIKVVERRAWVSRTSSNLIQHASSLLTRGRLDELEQLAKLIRSQRTHRSGKSGEELFSELATAIGEDWSTMEVSETSEAVQQAIDAWQQSNSELSRLAYAHKYKKIASDIRGRGLAADVTARQWTQFEANRQLAQNALKALRDDKQYSADLFGMLLNDAMHSDIGEQTYLGWLKQAVEDYPECREPIRILCVKMLPRWGGSAGDAGALLRYVADYYPKEHADALYARITLSLYSSFGPRILQNDEAGLSISRLLKGAEAMLEDERLTRAETELVIPIAKSNGKIELTERFSRYHFEHFGLLGPSGYDNTTLAEVAKARQRSFPANFEPSK